MKKRFVSWMSFLLVVMLCICMLSACGSDHEASEKPEKSKKTLNIGEEVLMDGGAEKKAIIQYGGFSEGLAFVQYYGDEAVYCIDETGKEVFSLGDDISFPDICQPYEMKFYHGLAYLNENAVCDTEGKITTPQDVGADVFCAWTMPAGYLFAGVATEGEADSEWKIGIMNTKFEWTVQPNKELYDLLGIGEYVRKAYMCSDEYMFINDEYPSYSRLIKLSTGEIMPIIDQYGKSIDDRHLLIPSDCWKKRYSNGMVEYYLEKYNGQLPLLTVEDSKDMGNFKNGVAVWRYYDEKTNNTYATLMDEKGNKKFNPVKCGVGGIWNDGQNILQYICYPKGKNGTTHIFTCWDGSGKKTGTMNIVDSQERIEFDFSNGILAARVTKKVTSEDGKTKNIKSYNLYDISFKRLL